MDRNCFLSLVSLMLLFFSCTADNYERITPSVVKSARKFDVSFSDVSSHIKHRRGTETKSGSCSIEPIVSGHDTLFYLVNYDRGWELLSADTRAAQVIAFAEDGHMSVDSLFPGPSAQALYSNIFNQLLYLKSNPGFVEASLSAGGWENEINNNIGDSDELMFADTILYVNLYQDHLTVTRWGQDYPWNMRAPYTNSSLSTHCKTGCVPVAAAQVLYYLSQSKNYDLSYYYDCFNDKYIPSGSNKLNLLFSDVTFYTPFNSSFWEFMPLTGQESSEYYKTVSTLMIGLGIMVEADYYTYGTYAYTQDICNVFDQYFGVSSTGTNIFDFSDVADQIFNYGFPSIISIVHANEQNNYSDGHCAIIDAAHWREGYIKNYYRRRGYKAGATYSNGYSYWTTTENINEHFVGINWGWDGDFMYSGSSPIWFNVDAFSWAVNGFVFNYIGYVINNFSE